ncbi:MAG: hypothetical protein WD080_09305, partial [Egibacteraceae bacterium]
PAHDPQAEAAVGEGAPPTPSGTPGVEAEGRHAEAHARDRSAEPGVSSAPLDDERAPTSDDADVDREPGEILDETSTRRDDRPSEAPETSDGEGDRP